MTKKTILVLLSGILCFNFAYSQDESDALRYSFLTPGGTARLQAIGGAGTSLGGDPSMMNLNPASIGMFKSNDFSFTPGLKSVTNTGNYLDGGNQSDNKTSFFIPQIALILASGNNNRQNKSDSKWKNVSLGIGLNRLANFNQNIFYQGNNKNSSYADNYAITTDNDNLGDSNSDLDKLAKNYPDGLSQAFETGLIGPHDSSGIFQYWESLPGNILNKGHSIHQSNTISTRGGINEFSLAVAGDYNDRLFIGGGLFVPSINYHRNETFRETNRADSSFLNYYDVTNSLRTNGVGINAKLGLIYIINPNIRVGLAFHSPTLYSMHDTYSTTIHTNTKDLGDLTSTTSDITNGYPNEYDYSLTTPLRVMGGLTYIVGATPEAKQHGFITLDYEYVNYGAARFHFNNSGSTDPVGDKAFAESLNNSTSQMYKSASNIRLGGEMKFNVLSLRAGVAYMGSPYENTQIKGAQMQYSGGIGIRTRGFYADLGYVFTDKGERINQPYLVKDNNFSSLSPAPAKINGSGSTFLLTFGFVM